MDVKLLNRLGEAFPKESIKSRQGVGRKLDYVEAPLVIRRLNQELEGRWSFEIVGPPIVLNQVTGLPGWVVVHGRLTLHAPEGQAPVVKDAFGSRDIGYYTKGPRQGEIMALGDEVKKAATDALKKCATQVGVALDLYKGEDYDEEGGATSAQADDASAGQQAGTAQGGAAAGGPPVASMEQHAAAVNAIAELALSMSGGDRKATGEIIAVAWSNLNHRGQVSQPATLGPAWRNLDIISMRALYAELKAIQTKRAANAVPAGTASAAPSGAAPPQSAAPVAPAAAPAVAAAPAAPPAGRVEAGPHTAEVPREPTGDSQPWAAAGQATAAPAGAAPPAQDGALRDVLQQQAAQQQAAQEGERRRADALKGELLARIKRRCGNDQNRTNAVFSQAWQNAHQAGKVPVPSEETYGALTYEQIRTIGEFAKPLLVG